MSTSSVGCVGFVGSKGANLDPLCKKHRWAAPKALLRRSDVRARGSIFAHYCAPMPVQRATWLKGKGLWGLSAVANPWLQKLHWARRSARAADVRRRGYLAYAGRAESADRKAGKGKSVWHAELR